MPDYNIYPGVDADFNFPPEIRKAFADSPEFVEYIEPQVTEVLAANPTMSDAAVKAVNTEVQRKGLAAMPGTTEEEIAFAIVDEEGRRSWLEMTYKGVPTEYSGRKISEAVGPKIAEEVASNVGIEEMNTELSGLAFVVLDEDDRRTEIEIGEDGRFTQRVIDSIGERIDPSIIGGNDPTQHILPSSIPLVVGQEYRLYFGSAIKALDVNHTPLILSQDNGSNLGTHWRFTPTTPKSFTLEIRVVDRSGALVKTASVPVTVYPASTGTERRHLAIGDSITRGATYVGAAVAPFSGMTTVGTRVFGSQNIPVEGRGGWSLNTYFADPGRTLGDSPFLFPDGVDGAKYWGNTEFWKSVCYTDPNGYDFQGFQKIARGWKDSPEPYLYGETGYPLAPAEGDVVVDPLLAASGKFRKFVGGSWTAMSPQPTVSFSFRKYMERYAAAFPNGGPTSISMMLMTNDFFRTLDTAGWIANTSKVIASIREWSATVPFIILTAPTGGMWDKWNGQTVNKFEFDNRIKDATSTIFTAFDTSGMRANRVYVASALGAVPPENVVDWVHPGPEGHNNLSKPLAGMIARLISEGVA